MTASSPSAFYLLELLRILFPSIGIAFVLAAVIRRYRGVRGPAVMWLKLVTAVWLFVTVAFRLSLSAPARQYFMSAAIRDYATAHRQSLYFAFGQWLWAAEQIIVVVFGVLLFVVLRGESRQHI